MVTAQQSHSRYTSKQKKAVVAVNKYDVLKPWSLVRGLIHRKLENEEEQVNTCITIGFQRVTSLHHTHALHCVEHVTCGSSSAFITQVNTGAANLLHVWKVRGEGEHKQVTVTKLEVQDQFEHLLYIPKLRVFVAYCADMSLHLYTDVTVGFKLICKTQAPRPLLCLAFNCSLCQLVCGAYGAVVRWDLSEYSWGIVTLLEALPLPVGPDDCVMHVSIDTHLRRLFFMMDSGGFAWDWGREEVFMQYQNGHSSALAHTAQHNGLDYFITASRDGSIKVFTRTGFRLMYTFTGQYLCITGLVLHPREPLLFSSSLDGTVRVWRLDTFEEQERVEIGEGVLGMMLLSQTELACWTQHDIYIYIINLQHGLFNATQSALVSMHYFNFPGLPDRVVATTEDGSIRFLCPMSGEEICIICPLPFLQSISDLALDRPEEKLYCLHDGEVLVFEVHTNPCQPEYRVQPHYQQTPVTCLTAIRANEALEDSDCAEELLIFTGHQDGMIRLMKSSHWQMKVAAGGHAEPVSLVSSSVPDPSHSAQTLGTRARLLSGGRDRCVCVWAIRQSSTPNQITLHLMQKIPCKEQPYALCMLGDTLCCSYKGCGQVAIVRCGEEFGEQQLMFHHGDENHTRPINGVSCLLSLHLFSSVGDDGVLKLWSLEGVLLREVVFSQPLHKVCFATQRGDLLLGYNNHIYVLPVERYLPDSLLSDLVSLHFQDEVKEEALPFDHSLPLWFDYASLPTHPLEPQLLSGLVTRSVRTRSEGREQSHTHSHTAGQNKVRLWYGLFPSEVDTRSPTSPQPRTPQYTATRHKPPGDRPHREADSMKTPSLTTDGLEREKSQTYVCPPPMLPRQTSLDTESSPQHTQPHRKRLPIAPDGYIPNSVVRSSFNIKPPENVWRKKKIQLRHFTSVSKSSVTGSQLSDSQTVKHWSEGSSQSQKRGGRQKRQPLTMAEAMAASRRLSPLPGSPDSRLHEDTRPTRGPAPVRSSASILTPPTKLHREFSETSLPSEIFEESADDELAVDDSESWRPSSGRLPPSLPPTLPHSPSPPTPPPLTPQPLPAQPQEPPPPARQDSGRPLLHLHKPQSGSCRLSREATEVSSAGSSHLRSRERLLEIRPLTRGSSLVLDTLQENPMHSAKQSKQGGIQQGGTTQKGAKQKATTSSQKDEVTSRRSIRQVSKPTAKSKPIQEVTKITLDTEVLPKRKVKERPVIPSRQNTSISSVVCDTPLEEEEESPVIEAPPPAETPPNHPLLEEIMGQSWFPGGHDVSVSGVVRGLCAALGSVSDHQHICNYILRLNSDLVISQSDLSMLVSSLRLELQSSSPGHREVAVKTLRGLGAGADTQKVLMEMLPLLLDKDETVKQEVTAALQELASVQNKDDLADLLTELGMSAAEDKHMHEEDTLQALKHKVAAQIPDVTDGEALGRIEVWVSKQPDKLTSNESDSGKEPGVKPAVSTPQQGSLSSGSTSTKVGGGQTSVKSGQPSPTPVTDHTPPGGLTQTKTQGGEQHTTVRTTAKGESKQPSPHTGRVRGTDHRADLGDECVDDGRTGYLHSQGRYSVKGDGSRQDQDTLVVPGSPTQFHTSQQPRVTPTGSYPPTQNQSPTGRSSPHHPSSLIRSHPQSPTQTHVHQPTTGLHAPSPSNPPSVSGSQRLPVIDPHIAGRGRHPPSQPGAPRHMVLPPHAGPGHTVPVDGTDIGQHGGSGQPYSQHSQHSAYLQHSESHPQHTLTEPDRSPQHTLTERDRSWTAGSGESGENGAQPTWKGKQRRRGNYTYFEWRSRSPRTEGGSRGLTGGASTVQTDERVEDGALPCDMCGSPVQIPSTQPHPRGTEDYSLYDQTYKYRRSQFGAIREWDETESPEYSLPAGHLSPHLTSHLTSTLPPVSNAAPHHQLGSLRIRGDSPTNSKKHSVRSREPDSGHGTEYLEEASTQLSSQLADADSGVLTDTESQPIKSRVHSLRSRGQPTLSPVRSRTDPDWLEAHSPPPENWREFFSRPEAQTRRNINSLKRQTSLPPSLPPISYVREDITIPGDPGIRLLQAVHVQNKEASVVGEPSVQRKQRVVQSLPEKLAINSKQDTGCSKFGILNMSWTSGAQKKRLEQTLSSNPTLADSTRASLVSSHTVLPSIGKEVGEVQPHLPGYQWATPLPPPPDSLADTCDPQQRHHHESYSDYYKLLKRRLSQYTSPVEHQHSLLRLCRQRSRLHSNLSQHSLKSQGAASRETHRPEVKQKAGLKT